MQKLGFHDKWNRLIMKCVSTVSYKIRVNNEYTKTISPGRGLRQGDPLSPYLFVIYAEALSMALHAAEAARRIMGVKICKQAPSLTHLFFADDSLLLLSVRKDEAIEVRNILSNYEKCSGQTINKDKSVILFSANVTNDVKGSFLHHIGITSEVYNEKCFGLPVFTGKSKAKAFAFLKQKIWSRIQGWKEKLLSKAGKEILIKAIAQAIPVYAMSCFYLTKSVCDELTTMVLRYWWAQQEKDRKNPLVGKRKNDEAKEQRWFRLL